MILTRRQSRTKHTYIIIPIGWQLYLANLFMLLLLLFIHILGILFTLTNLIILLYDTCIYTYVQRLRMDISRLMALYKCSSSSCYYD